MVAEFRDADDLLAQAERSSYSHAGEALADLQLIVASLNQEFDAIVSRRGSVEWQVQSETGDRLRQLLKRLVDLVTKIARDFGAISYSVECGFPKGFSASLSWKGPKA